MPSLGTFARFTSTCFDAVLCRLQACLKKGSSEKCSHFLGLVPQATHLRSAVPSEAFFVTPQQVQPGEFFLSFDGWGAQAQDGDCSLLAAKKGLKELFALW